MNKTPTQVVEDSLHEKGSRHHPKCGCNQCNPEQKHIMPMTIDRLADLVHANAVNKGFHDMSETEIQFMANQCNNLHAEVSELWDAYRSGKEIEPCDKAIKMIELGIKPLSCREEELADIIIRALDQARRLKIDIYTAIMAKHAYNTTRPHKHGKKN